MRSLRRLWPRLNDFELRNKETGGTLVGKRVAGIAANGAATRGPYLTNDAMGGAKIFDTCGANLSHGRRIGMPHAKACLWRIRTPELRLEFSRGRARDRSSRRRCRYDIRGFKV